MFKIALKNTMARKGRLALTALAVIAGCAFLSGVFVFSDTINGTFDRLFANAYAKTDAFVRSSNVIEGDFGSESRDRLPDSVIAEVAAVPGVAEAVGDVQSFARIATLDGKGVGQDGPPKYGGVFQDSSSSPWALAEGRKPANGSEVVIDRAASKSAKIKLGDQVDITTKQGVQRFTVVGIATFAGSDTSGGATWALFDLPTAESFVLGKPGIIDSVVVRGDGSVSDETLKADIQKAVSGQEIEVLTGAEITKENQDSIEQGLSFFTIFLTIFAAISLFVGSFIIYNVFSISAAQRQRENALLRAIGASRAQVTRSMFIEATIVGLFGGLVGFASGVGLAALIMKLLTALGVGPSDTVLEVNVAAFVETVIVGVVVTLLCAIIPAIRSGRVPPLAAMRDVAVDHSGVSRSRLVTGLVFVALAAVGVGLGLTADAKWLGLGVAALFATVVVLGPLAAAPIARGLTRPLRSVKGVTGEIAGRNAATSPKRTALTAGALGIGLALLIGVSSLGSSVKESIRSSIGDQFTGDFAVSATDQGFGGLPIELADKLNDLPQVADAVGIGANLINVVEKGTPKGKQVLVVVPARAAGLFDLPFVSGGWSGLNADSILVSKDKADRDGLTLGSTVEVVLQDKTTKQLKVAGLFDSNDFGNLIVDRTLFEGQDTDLFDVQILVQTKPGVSERDAETAIRDVATKYPTSKVQTRAQFIDNQSSQVDGFLNFIYGLLGMSIFIAILGILITMLLAVYERRRELGLVRAIGMTRPQVRSSVRWEAFVTAVLGVIIGVCLGVSLGWIVVQALHDQGLNTFSVSPITIVIFSGASVLFAVAAAAYPAWKGAKADILQAIATT